MKTMQVMQKMKAKQASKDRACALAWHRDRWVEFREPSEGFSQRDVSELDYREGAF